VVKRIHIPTYAKRATPKRRPRAAGMSLVELLVSLAITALLLTAVMVATDASFRAYAAAAETASTQTATRMVVHRLLTMIRTSTAHGPLEPDAGANPPVILNGNTIESNYLELIDSQGSFVRIEYRQADQEIWAVITPMGTSTAEAQPVLGGVTAATFYATRRIDNDGVLVMERGAVDMTVESDTDSTLAIEADDVQPIRVIASTRPRKLD
jgi:Tfp pilus assembly protein PilW